MTAVELEPAAIDVIRANAARNRVAVDALRRPVRDERRWAPTVVANLRPVLLRAPRARAPPERLIAAGMLAHEADEVAPPFAPLRERRRVEDDGWAAVVLA